ncbi:MAG: M20/M25/M40 family metallo-hydrolase [Myxococcota bacterium]
MSNAAKAAAHFDANRRDYLEDLKALVAIPSISFPGFDHSHMKVSAQATADLLKKRGFDKVEILPLDDAHPYVFAEVVADPKAPTLLLYAHHDVQPAGDASQWTSPPFTPTERNGRLYGRGTSDDKVGISIHAAAVDSWRKAGGGKLPVNLKFLIEGEEEIGSAHLMKFLHKHLDRLQADAIIITDTANIDTGIPSLTNSLRGMAAVDVEVKVLKGPLHSGMWGGPLPDAAMALCKILARLTKDDGSVDLPGFYEKVMPMNAAERASLEKLPIDKSGFRKMSGILDGVPLTTEGSPFEAIWRKPTIAINAMQASSRADARNILVESAWARVGVRLVPDQDPKAAQDALVKKLEENPPFGAQVTVTRHQASPAWHCSTEHPAFQAAARSLQAGFGREPTILGAGGSIPFVGPFCEALGGVPAIMLGIEDPYSYIHGIDESQHIGDWERVTKSTIHLYEELATTLRK